MKQIYEFILHCLYITSHAYNFNNKLQLLLCLRICYQSQIKKNVNQIYTHNTTLHFKHCTTHFFYNLFSAF